MFLAAIYKKWVLQPIVEPLILAGKTKRVEPQTVSYGVGMMELRLAAYTVVVINIDPYSIAPRDKKCMEVRIRSIL